MTVEELRAEATKLPPSERTQLAHALLLEEQLESWDLPRLRAEIQVGVDQLARGEAQTFNSNEELRSYFDDVKARGRQRLAARERGLGS
jgi:hypothetical protein